MKKIQQAFDQGVQQVSALLDQWGVPLNATQYKVINSLQAYVKSTPSEAEIKNFSEQCCLQSGMATALENYLKAECEEKKTATYEDVMDILTGVVGRSIRDKQAIAPSLLYLVSKHATLPKSKKDEPTHFVETKFWKDTLRPSIQQTLQCEEIISDPVGWKWMETCILKSPLWLLKRDDLLHMNEELLSIAKEELQTKPLAIKRKQQETHLEEKDESDEKKKSRGTGGGLSTATKEKYEEEWMKLYHAIANQANMFHQTIQFKFHLSKQLQEACKNTNTLARLALHTQLDVESNVFVDSNAPLLARALENKDYRSSLVVIRDLKGFEKIDWTYTFSEDKQNTYLHQIFKRWGDDVNIVKQFISHIPKKALIQQLNTKNKDGNSALMYAITEGDMTALQWLLEYCKDDIDWTYFSGERTYFHAIVDYFHRNTKGLKQLFQIIGPKNLAIQFQMKDSEGKTPLMVCLDRNVSEDVIVRLLECVESINWKIVEPKIQRTHLHQICASCLKNEKQALQIIELLPEEAFALQINLQDKRKQTPLMAAFPAIPSKTVILALCKKKKDTIDWSLKDQTEMTYLHFAARYYHHDVDTFKAFCEEIIPKNQLKSQSECRDKKGKLPLEYAQEHEAPVEVLDLLKNL